MTQSSRELVQRALGFEFPERIPRDLWQVPWARQNYPNELDELIKQYPSDFAYPPNIYNPAKLEKGDPYAVGRYVDAWGCTFENIHKGIIGEVKQPLLEDINNLSALHVPYEIMPTDRQQAIDKINQFCDETEKFVFGCCCPRPWEQLQFLRGSVNAMMDIMDPEGGVCELLARMQEFYLEQMEFWAATKVDALMCMDDWGSQQSLLIPPKIWEAIFKPMYKEYCDLAHAAGKFIFMHSDGCITDIYPHLVDVGIDAVNSQLFCMDMAEIAKSAKGRITFLGRDRSAAHSARP